MKLLVSDYDGTITANIKDIKINCTFIAKFIRNGNIFAISSGRSYQSLITAIHRQGIPHNYISCFDGISTYKNDGKLLWKYEMDKEIIDKLHDLIYIKLHRTLYYVYNEDYVEKKMNLPIRCISIPVRINKLNNKFIQEFNKIKNENQNYDYFTYEFDGDVYFNIKPKGVSKSTSVEDLRLYLGIDKKDVFTVGDSLNDFEMIRDYNGYVIGNNRKLKGICADTYDSVYKLIGDIEKQKVKRRF